MSPQEVHGLQSLAKAHGTSLTINPHTGMPEAFSLGGFFKAALPMIAGFALGPGGFGLGESLFGAGSFMSSALGSGLLVGGLTGLATGNLGQGLMAGLGAYGGHGLGDMFSKLGTAAPVTSDMATKALESQTGANLVGGNEIGMFNQFPGSVSGASPFADAGLSNIPASGGEVGMANSFPKTMGGSGPINPVSAFNTTGFSNSGKGVSSLFEEGGWDRAKNILGTQGTPGGTSLVKDINGVPVEIPTAAKAGTPLTNMQMVGKLAPTAGGLALGAFGDDLMPKEPELKDRQKRIQTGTDAQGNPIYTYMAEAAYSPYETLNLNNPLANYPDRKQAPALVLPETRLAAEGGMINSFAGGGSVPGMPTPFNSGVSDQYNIPDGTQAQNTPSSPYGLGRLSTLASQQSNEQAKTLGYADGGLTALSHGGTPQAGGYLDGQGDGMSDSIPATIEGKQPARLADGEFVVPADVVSHLGNGSSKAGSKRLYAMLDKVRKARTGHTKQGRQINPNKFLLA